MNSTSAIGICLLCVLLVSVFAVGKGAAQDSDITLQEALVRNVGDRIFFAEGSSVLDGPGENGRLDTLRKLAAWMKAHPNTHVFAEGHAQDPGTRKDNLVLAAERALAAVGFLVAAGIACERVTPVSYGGERMAVAASSSAGAAAQNRRVVFVVGKPWYGIRCD